MAALALAGALAFLVVVDILAVLALGLAADLAAFGLAADLATFGLTAATFLGLAAAAFLGLAAADFTAFLGLVADLATFLGLAFSAFLAFLATPASWVKNYKELKLFWRRLTFCLVSAESLKEPAPFLPAWAPGTRRPSFSMARMVLRYYISSTAWSWIHCVMRMCLLQPEQSLVSLVFLVSLVMALPCPPPAGRSQPSPCRPVPAHRFFCICMLDI